MSRGRKVDQNRETVMTRKGKESLRDIDELAKELQAENEARLRRNSEIEKNMNEIFSNADKKLSELREEDGVIVEKNDELYDAAVQAILASGVASTSTVQRALGIGYTKAAKLIDQMEEQGIISEYKFDEKGRTILVEKDKKTNTQSHKTPEGQAFGKKYEATVDHEKAQEAVQASAEQPTVEKEK